MIRIALIEDESEAKDLFVANLDRYSKEHGIGFTVAHFCNAMTFLESYKPVYDIVFMDIRMPDMNGLDAAHRLRQLDPSVILIFLTNLSQYAVRGYEVNALDFIVKPISYYVLVLKLERALHRLENEGGGGRDNGICRRRHRKGARRRSEIRRSAGAQPYLSYDERRLSLLRLA